MRKAKINHACASLNGLFGISVGLMILLLFGGFDNDSIPRQKLKSNMDIWIDGHVTDQFGTPVPVSKIEYFNKTTMDLLATDYTDQNGHYETSIWFVGQEEHITLEKITMFPNPSEGLTNLTFNSIDDETYKLTIIDIGSRKVLYSSSVKVKAGQNKVTITGGNQGVHIIVLDGKDGRQTYKSIQMTNNGSNFQHTTSWESNSTLKSTTNDPVSVDSLLIVYSKMGYVTNDTTVAPITQTINVTLEKLPTIHNVKIKPYTINGDAITSLTLDFKWQNGAITEHSVDPDGFIYVHREEFTNITSVAFVTHNNDTATYALWQFFRLTEGHQLKDTNYAQSPKELTLNYPTNYYTEPTATPLNLPEGDDTLKLDLYLPHTQVPHPMQPGQYIRLDDYEVRYIMSSRGAGTSTKYIDIPAIPRKFIHYQFTFDETNPGTQMPAVDLQLAVTERAKILEKFTLNNSKRVFPEDTTATFTSTSDPLYQQIVVEEFYQSARTNFKTGSSTPGNNSYLTTNHSSNGKPIIYNSYSTYPAPVGSQMFEEMFQQYTYTNDGLTSGLGGWIHNGTTGEMTDFGEEIIHFLYMANQGTNVH